MRSGSTPCSNGTSACAGPRTFTWASCACRCSSRRAATDRPATVFFSQSVRACPTHPKGASSVLQLLRVTKRRNKERATPAEGQHPCLKLGKQPQRRPRHWRNTQCNTGRKPRGRPACIRRSLYRVCHVRSFRGERPMSEDFTLVLIATGIALAGAALILFRSVIRVREDEDDHRPQP